MGKMLSMVKMPREKFQNLQHAAIYGKIEFNKLFENAPSKETKKHWEKRLKETEYGLNHKDVEYE